MYTDCLQKGRSFRRPQSVAMSFVDHASAENYRVWADYRAKNVLDVTSQHGRVGTLSNAFADLLAQAGLRPERSSESTGRGRSNTRAPHDNPKRRCPRPARTRSPAAGTPPPATRRAGSTYWSRAPARRPCRRRRGSRRRRETGRRSHFIRGCRGCGAGTAPVAVQGPASPSLRSVTPYST